MFTLKSGLDRCGRVMAPVAMETEHLSSELRFMCEHFTPPLPSISRGQRSAPACWLPGEPNSESVGQMDSGFTSCFWTQSSLEGMKLKLIYSFIKIQNALQHKTINNYTGTNDRTGPDWTGPTAVQLGKENVLDQQQNQEKFSSSTELNLYQLL